MSKPTNQRASFLLESFETRQLLSATLTTTGTTTATPTPPPAPDIVGSVYLDRNSDGIKGKTERALRRFTVDLVDSNGDVVQTLRTNRRGHYAFSGLTDGATYTVKVESKDGFIATTNTSVAVTIAADKIARVNFGEIRTSTPSSTASSTGSTGSTTGSTDGAPTDKPAAPTPPSVCGLVFLDRNADQTPNRGDIGLHAFTVTLTDSSGKVVGTTATDRHGRYKFDGVADGTYTVSVTAKDGFTASGAQTATITVASGSPTKAAFGETSTTATAGDTGASATHTGNTDDTGSADPATPPPGGRHGRRGPANGPTGSATGSANGAAAGPDDGSDATPPNCPPPPSGSGDNGATVPSAGATAGPTTTPSRTVLKRL